MGLAKAWKKRDDKLNTLLVNSAGTVVAGARSSCRHDPRCDAPPSLFTPPVSLRITTTQSASRHQRIENGGDGERPFAQFPSKHPPMARFEDVHMGMPPAERKARVPLITGSSPRRGNWERQSSRRPLECEKKSSGTILARHHKNVLLQPSPAILPFTFLSELRL